MGPGRIGQYGGLTPLHLHFQVGNIAIPGFAETPVHGTKPRYPAFRLLRTPRSKPVGNPEERQEDSCLPHRG